MMIQHEPFTTTCPDGVVLSGKLIVPPKPQGVVQFNGGTGSKKEFYLPFLEFLAENHFVVCLWDYRGSGESAPPTLRNCAYRFLTFP